MVSEECTICIFGLKPTLDFSEFELPTYNQFFNVVAGLEVDFTTMIIFIRHFWGGENWGLM